MKIQVLGSGCPTCKKLFEQTKEAVADLKLKAEVEYSTDVSKIIELGIMSSPVLVVDGNPVMVGAPGNTDKIKSLLSGAKVEISNEKPKCSCGGNC